MTSYYTDDEQVERLKTWWRTYGPAVVLGVVIGVGAMGGIKYWRYYTAQQSAEASALYETFVGELRRNNLTEAVATGERLAAEYRRTVYADFAALALAKTRQQQGDIDAALVELQRLADSGVTAATRQVARLRLATLLTQQGNYEQAVAVLGDSPAPGFESEFHELRGDIWAAAGQNDKARDAYEQALNSPLGTPEYRQVLQMKLDDTGAGEG